MEMKAVTFFYLIIICEVCFINHVNGAALVLTSSNFDQIIANHEVVFINFYADWCRFSNILQPIWDDFEKQFRLKFPSHTDVVIAKVDSDSEKEIASRFHVTKYPTMKLLRNGSPMKREYRGQRSTTAFLDFLEAELKDPVKRLNTLEDIQNIKKNKRSIIGYFDHEKNEEFNVFSRVARQLKADCDFYAGFGDVVRSMHPPNESIVVFHSAVTGEEEVTKVNLRVFDEVLIWTTERCVPTVRTITFENAEELTEEGLPFLILFHHSDDLDVVSRFTKFVSKNLHSKKQQINFLHADGKEFSHPLSHLGKSTKDLPLIAIDSFRHMYLFPDINKMEVPGRLERFIDDLASGKLHREFHYGPDPDQKQEDERKNGDDNILKGTDDSSSYPPTTVPESQFQHLQPSRNRYTFKDEF